MSPDRIICWYLTTGWLLPLLTVQVAQESVQCVCVFYPPR